MILGAILLTCTVQPKFRAYCILVLASTYALVPSGLVPSL